MRQSLSAPLQGKAEMASAALERLADPNARPEVRAWAAWALGLMRVNPQLGKYNYSLIAHTSASWPPTSATRSRKSPRRIPPGPVRPDCSSIRSVPPNGQPEYATPACLRFPTSAPCRLHQAGQRQGARSLRGRGQPDAGGGGVDPETAEGTEQPGGHAQDVPGQVGARRSPSPPRRPRVPRRKRSRRRCSLTARSEPSAAVGPIPEVREYPRINAEVVRHLDAGHARVVLAGAGGHRLLLHRLTGPWNAVVEVEGHAGPELAAELDAPGLDGRLSRPGRRRRRGPRPPRGPGRHPGERRRCPGLLPAGRERCSSPARRAIGPGSAQRRILGHARPGREAGRRATGRRADPGPSTGSSVRTPGEGGAEVGSSRSPPWETAHRGWSPKTPRRSPT